MDKSELRQGKVCWYKKDGVGLIAINDVFSLESFMFMLLKKYFRDKKYYVDIVHLFQEVTFQTVLGQSLDLLMSRQFDISKLTVEAYCAIAKYKTAYCAFYLPVALAMFMVGIFDTDLHHRAKKVLLEMGHLHQVQDDFVDCFGDPLTTGTVGTDMEEGKCSWLVVTALQCADETQKNIIQEHYCRKEPECQAKIKALYQELGLPAKYRAYEDECYKKIIDLIDHLEGLLNTKIFYEMINDIYKING